MCKLKFNISVKDLDLGVERVIIEYVIDAKLGGLAEYFRKGTEAQMSLSAHIRKVTTKP